MTLSAGAEAEGMAPWFHTRAQHSGGAELLGEVERHGAPRRSGNAYEHADEYRVAARIVT